MPTTEPINPGPVATIRIPFNYWRDRANRELPCGRQVRNTWKAVTVDIRRDDLIDLLDDATYYAEMKGTPDGRENPEMVRYAIRALESIAIQIGESDDPAIERYLTEHRINGERKRAKRAAKRAARRHED